MTEKPKLKLVASDMDGTLLNSNAALPSGFFGLLDEMKRRGIAFAAASGRQIHNMKTKFGAYANDIYFVAENGAYITKAGKELLELSLKREEISTLLKIAREIKDAYIVLSGKKFAYIENPDPVFLAKLTSYSGYIKPVKDISEIENDTFFKFTICDLSNPSTNSMPKFSRLKNEFQIKVSGTKWLDITHKNADKGKAIRMLQKLLNASPDECAAFGDYLNDIEMLKSVKYSFAMENAHPDIKKIAKFKTYSNNDDGVPRALSLLL